MFLLRECEPIYIKYFQLQNKEGIIMYPKESLRSLFPGLENEVPIAGGRYVKEVNFDNAATTPPFNYCLKNIEEFSQWYSSIHRGTGYKSRKTTEFYDQSRQEVLKFVNGNNEKYTVIYVKNATEGLNKLSYKLIKSKDDIVLSTMMEHHSNDLPWRSKCIVDYIDITPDGKLDINDLIYKLEKYKGRVKVVTVTGASNVTGIINDIHFIAKLVHKCGAKIIVDGAQLVPHKKVSMIGNTIEEDIDYLVFSSHKMYAPFGIGVIVGKKSELNEKEPEYSGGGTIKYVTPKRVVWDDTPMRDEAGTPNVLGVMGLMSSMEILDKIGMDNIYREEIYMKNYLLKKLRTLPISIYGQDKEAQGVGIVSFSIGELSHRYIAETLSKYFGIAVRNGCFCAHPYVQRLLDVNDHEMDFYIRNQNLEKPGLVRASLALYNTKEEADRFIEALYRICRSNKVK